MSPRPPIHSRRVRRIGDGSFAFIPHRLLRGGFFASLSMQERSLYLFLVLAADRNGVSFYGHDRICATLEVPLDVYLIARDGLINKDLIAFDGVRFQVLSLPEKPASIAKPLRTRDDLLDHDPATIRKTILDAFDDDGSRS